MPNTTPINKSAKLPQLILIGGPTAVGKSDVALLLAEQVEGEIIVVDSMQVYRGLDIGTAKPNAIDRARVPHHLIDVVELTDTFNAARFVELAHKAIADIHTRGRVPILCGGTGLYFKAFLAGLGDAPPPDPILRAQLETTPLPELLRELAERDPVLYAKIDRNNPRRVIRAVEVIRLTGKPFSAQRADWQLALSNLQFEIRFFGLARAPADLHERIDARVDAMFRNGLVEETERLLKLGLASNKTAMQAIGYRQVVEYLRGQRSLPETIQLVKIRTRQFAKRQMTWFSRQLNIEWLKLAPKEPASETVARIRKLLG